MAYNYLLKTLLNIVYVIILFQGTGVGELRNPSDPEIQGLKTHGNNNEDPNTCWTSTGLPRSTSETLRIRFKVDPLSASAPVAPTWETVLWQNRLYVSMTAQQLAEGSKDAFVQLLEYAEETLKCEHVVVCLNSVLGDTKNIVRNFLFLGFQPLAPGHEFLPNNPNLVSNEK